MGWKPSSGSVRGAINAGAGTYAGGGLGTGGMLAGGAAGAGGFIDKNNPYVQGPRQQRKAKAEADAKAGELYAKTGEINKGLDKADAAYGKTFDKDSREFLSGAKNLVKEYTGQISQLQNESKTQASDARATYTNSILPGYKDAMGKAKVNADAAMSLEQASDPNNAVMKGVRELYNKQGESARRQGQQDFGVLSALGAQAAQGQFGAGGPMTSGQMGQIYAANQSQAGDAYARAQNRMHDLQQQGIDRGFDQSNQMYQFGQQAQDRYSNTIKDLQGGEGAFYDQQGRFRDEQGGYAGDVMGAKAGYNSDRFNMGMIGSDVRKGNAYAGAGRRQVAENQYYGTQQQNINNKAGADSATNASKGQFISSLVGAGGQMGAAAVSDKRKKHNISDISDSELDEFLSSVKPKSFNYDDPQNGAGKRVGFMLQDVQGTELGDKITRKDGNGTLKYDRDNLNGIILAALARDARRAA